jgi:hypothetical protein
MIGPASSLSTPSLLRHLALLVINIDWCRKHGVPHASRLSEELRRRAARAAGGALPPGQAADGPSAQPSPHACSPAELLQLLLCMDALGGLRTHSGLLSTAAPALQQMPSSELEAAVDGLLAMGVPLPAPARQHVQLWVEQLGAEVAAKARQEAHEGLRRMQREGQRAQGRLPGSSSGASAASAGEGGGLAATLARLAASSADGGERREFLDSLQRAEPPQLRRLGLQQLAALRLALLQEGRPEPPGLAAALLAALGPMADAYTREVGRRKGDLSQHVAALRAIQPPQLSAQEALALAECLVASGLGGARPAARLLCFACAALLLPAVVGSAARC